MTIDECAKVLAKIQLGDNRQADRLVLAEWFDTIGHLPFADAIKAVTMHRQESTDYLMPAHLIRNFKRISEQRALTGSPECPIHPGYPITRLAPTCAACDREQADPVGPVA